MPATVSAGRGMFGSVGVLGAALRGASPEEHLGEDQERLIAGLRARESWALETLYDRLGARAFGLAFRILGRDDAAEDVVQEAFLAIWHRADRLDSSRGDLGGYVMTVVHHRAIDAARREQRRAVRQRSLDPLQDDPADASADIDTQIASSYDREAVRRSLGQLPEAQRVAIEMAYFGGLTHDEIAEELGVPSGTVKSRLRLGLNRMRGLLFREVRE